MHFIKQHGRHLSLSIFTVFLPLVLLVFAGVVDYIYDHSSLLAVGIRFLPIHLVLMSLVYLTVRITRDETFESVEYSSKHDRQWLLISCAVSLTLVVLMFWPISNFSSHLFGGNGDGYNWRWQIWRMSQEFRQWHIFPTRFDDVISPYGVDLRLNDGYLAMYIGGLWNLIARPTLAYNMTLATAVILNFLAARKLSLSISNSQITGIIAGIVMATAPSITLRHMGHLNLCFTFVLCLAAVEGIKLLEESNIRIWQPVLILALAFFSSFYFFVLSGIFYAACALIRLAKSFGGNEQSVKTSLARLTSVAIITGIFISPFILARLHHDSVERTAGAPAASARTDEYMFYSADPRTFFLPPSDARIQLPQSAEIRRNTSPNTVENTPFPGYLALLSVASIILFVRKWRWFIASLWSIFTILALGPTLIWGAESQLAYFFPHAVVESAISEPITWLPYGDLTAIPGLSALRTPNRFAMILPVIGVIALAAIANEILKRQLSRKNRSLMLALVALLVVPNLRSSDYWYDTSFSSPVTQALDIIRQDPTEARVFVAGQNCVQTISMANLQVEHLHPMIGCQTFSAAVPWYSSLEEYRNSSAVAALQCDTNTFGLSPMNPKNVPSKPADVLKELKKSLDVGYVVLPKNLGCTDSSRTQGIIDILNTSPNVLVDTSDFLIVTT